MRRGCRRTSAGSRWGGKGGGGRGGQGRGRKPWLVAHRTGWPFRYTVSLRKWTHPSRMSVPIKTVLVGSEWRLVRRPARSMPLARAGRRPRLPGSHWVSSIRSAGVSVGGTWRQASCPRTSPYMQYFMPDTGHPCPVPAPRWVEDGERPSAPPMCTSRARSWC